MLGKLPHILGLLMYGSWALSLLLGLPLFALIAGLAKEARPLKWLLRLFGALSIALLVLLVAFPHAARTSSGPAPPRLNLFLLFLGHALMAIPLLLPDRLLFDSARRRPLYAAVIAGGGAVLALAVGLQHRVETLNSVGAWSATAWRALIPVGAFVVLLRTAKR